MPVLYQVEQRKHHLAGVDRIKFEVMPLIEVVNEIDERALYLREAAKVMGQLDIPGHARTVDIRTNQEISYVFTEKVPAFQRGYPQRRC